MKRYSLLPVLILFLMSAHAQSFSRHFRDSTLRLDYIFAGDTAAQHIFVDQLSMTPRWYGRRQHLAKLPLKGNGQLTVTDPQTGDTLYRHAFATLFQEWLATNEAKHTARSFENVFLMPYPRHAVHVTIELYDHHGHPMARLSHPVSPDDILIRQLPGHTPYVTLQQAADTTRCIHIAYVAEGYTEEQMPQFLDDCLTAMEALFSHEPFTAMRERFNIIAVCPASADTDVSQPGKGIWRTTALASHFDTFYSERYLTTLRLKQLHDVLGDAPYEHIIILANTPHYGGGGIYNAYNLSYTRGQHFRPVVVHEFGHSFGGLGDEYSYDGDPVHFDDAEPWEPNLDSHTGQPLWPDCRMRTNEHPTFCPACQQALQRLIDFYTR